MWVLIQNNSLLSWYYKLRNFSWKFWFHLLQLYQTICLCILVDTPDHQSFSNECAFIWKKDGVFLSCNFRACFSSISNYLEFTTFSESTFCSGEVLLNQLNKRAKLRGGVKWIELLETFVRNIF